MNKYILIAVSFFIAVSCSDNDDGNNNSSCCGQDAFVVEINNLSGDIEIAPFNVITPNSDGINDIFVISGLAAYPNNSLRVFSNNTLVFESSNYHLNQIFGDDLIDDSFAQKVFTYELLVDNGDSFKAKGTICAIKSSSNDSDSCNAFDLSDPLLN